MSKDVLILHIPNVTYKQKISPLNAQIHAIGLFSLSNELNKNNISAEIVNLGVEYEIDKNFSIYDYVRINRFKIIAFSLHWFFQMYDTIEVAKKIKKLFPDIIIIFGGYTASCFADELLTRFNFIDYIIKGEGEVPILYLCQYLLGYKTINKDKIPNLIYKTNNKIVENENKWFASSFELNSFNFSNLNNMKNFQYYSCIYIVLGRGCHGNCSCCGGGAKIAKTTYNRPKISTRKTNVIVNEITNLYYKYNISNFSIIFDCKDDLIIEIIEKLWKKIYIKLSFEIECFKLPSYKLIDAVFKYLHNNSRIVISADFAYEKFRKLHKSFYFSNKDFYKILDYMNKKGVKGTVFFSEILNDNINERDSKIEMVDILKSKYSNIHVSDGYVTFDPNSPIINNPKKYYLDELENIIFDFDYYYKYWANHKIN